MTTNQSGDNKNLDENLLDHNYDGVQELDNPLPAWWVNLFYGTIGFAVVYMIAFTFFIPSAGALADKKVEELTGKLTQKVAVTGDVKSAAEAAVAEVSFPSDAAALEAGKAVFAGKCLACHGAKGEGLVGPNLTDDFWIHGKGTEADIYKVVTEGVPEKGMISWKTLLKEDEIKSVTVYVKSLHGTNPENAKPPQGEKVG